jgi:hypothetical protein
MRPIRYADHCASCHPLSVRLLGTSEDALVRGAFERFAREPAVHQSPAVVRAVLRERILELLRDQPLNAAAAPEPARPVFPGMRTATEVRWKRSEKALSISEHRSFVELQLGQMETALFDRAGGCKLCHVPSDGNSLRQTPVYEPTSLPARWQGHARFRHAAHQMLRCADCHPAADSQHSSDVLIPTTPSTCAACHAAGAGARHDCVSCHAYHHAGR